MEVQSHTYDESEWGRAINHGWKNLLPVYHKYLFAQYFPNFKALIAIGTQIEDAINYGTIKNEDAPEFEKNFGTSSSKTT